MDGTGTSIMINYTDPVLVFLSPYYPTTYKPHQYLQSGKNYTIGRDFDHYLGNSFPDSFYIGIVNPSNSDQKINAVMYQQAFNL